MVRNARNIAEVLEMNVNCTKYLKYTESTPTEDECNDRVCDTSGTDVLQSLNVEDNNENTYKNSGNTKKRKRSEKQKERVREYKRKNRKAKRQHMAAEKRMDKNSIESDDVFCILTVYEESSLHVKFGKECKNNTRTHCSFGYEYFSISNFLK